MINNSKIILIIAILGWQTSAVSETKFVDKTCAFKNIPINTAYKNECSPVIFEDNFVGIKIIVPKVVRVSQSGEVLKEKETMLPVVGYYNLPLGELINDASIKLIVENSKTGKRYTAMINDRNNAQLMANRAKDYSKKKLKEQMFGSYINPNLTKYLSLPNTSAKYDIRVAVGKFESNIARVKVNADDDFIQEW